MNDTQYTKALDDFCVEIDQAIRAFLESDNDAPVEDAIREVVNGMLLGEDEDTQIEIRQRYRI